MGPTAIVNLDVTGPRISRHLYGHFAEHLGRCINGGFWVGEDSPVPNVGGIRRDVVEALRELRIPNLRWPGGCFADEYHWRDGVGPRAARPTMVNTHWGDVVEDNSFGTHEFMALCELLGAEPYVNGNVGSGTVREMSEWVEYLTRAGDSPMARLRRTHGRQEPWRVPYWGIGNEPWGCGGNMTPEYYANEARRYATFVKDHGDNRLWRIAAGGPDDDVRWTRALIQAAVCRECGADPERPTFEGISFHYYTHSGEGINTASATEFTREQYYRTVAHAVDVERVIRAHEAVMDSYDPERRVGLALDEWGTWWNVAEGTNPGFLFQQNTMRDAIVAAVHFDAFHRHAARLRMANLAQTLNVLQAVLITDQDGALVRTPTYHVFEMNRGHHDALTVHTALLEAPHATVNERAIPLVSASASRHEHTALISLTHAGLDAPLPIQVDLRGLPATVRRARVLTADQPAAHNTPAAPEAVSPAPLDVTLDGATARLTLPPHSFATLELDL